MLGCFHCGFPTGLVRIYLFNYFDYAITKICPRTSFIAGKEEVADRKLSYFGIMITATAVLEMEEGILM